MRSIKNILLLLVAGFALVLGTVACSNDDDSTTPANTKVTVVTVTNGVAAAGESVEIANLTTYLSKRGGKLYADKEGKTEVATSAAKAGTTYYAIINAETNTAVKVIVVTNGTEDAGRWIEPAGLSDFVKANGGKLYSDKAGTTEVDLTKVTAKATYYVVIKTVKVITVTNGTENAGEDIQIANLSTYLSTRGGKLYSDQTFATEVEVAKAEAGKTYYAKVLTRVKIITVTNGTPNAGEDVELANLSTYLSTRGGKMYKEQACTTEVAVSAAVAGTTYYAKVTAVANTKVKIITITNGTANAGEDVEIANLTSYLSTRGGKMYKEQACTTEVAVSAAVAGTTYYAKVTAVANTKVKIITITDGTTNAGEDVEIANLTSYLSSRGGKMYKEQACTTEVAVSAAVAGTTYYAKVTTSSGTGTNVWVITYYLTNSSDVSSKSKVAEASIAKDKLAEYIKYRGNKLYAKDDRTEEVAVANAVAGKTYYVFYDDNTPKVKVWRVKAGTESTGNPEFIKEMNDGGYDMTWIAYLDKYLNEKNVNTLYKWENNKKGAAVATSAVVQDNEYCIVYLPAAAATYTLTYNGKSCTLTTDAEGGYKITEGSATGTEIENGKYAKTSDTELYTKVTSKMQTSYGMSTLMALTPDGAELKVTYTIGANNVLTEKSRSANFVTVVQVVTADFSMTNNLLISGLQAYLDGLNKQGATYKLYEDKAKTKPIAVDKVVAEKTYYACM